MDIIKGEINKELLQAGFRDKTYSFLHIDEKAGAEAAEIILNSRLQDWALPVNVWTS